MMCASHLYRVRLEITVDVIGDTHDWKVLSVTTSTNRFDAFNHFERAVRRSREGAPWMPLLEDHC